MIESLLANRSRRVGDGTKYSLFIFNAINYFIYFLMNRHEGNYEILKSSNNVKNEKKMCF